SPRSVSSEDFTRPLHCCNKWHVKSLRAALARAPGLNNEPSSSTLTAESTSKLSNAAGTAVQNSAAAAPCTAYCPWCSSAGRGRAERRRRAPCADSCRGDAHRTHQLGDSTNHGYDKGSGRDPGAQGLLHDGSHLRFAGEHHSEH